MKLEKKLDIKLDNVIINNININDYVPVDEYNSKVEELNITKEDLIKTETELSKSQLELDSTKEILIEKESELVEAKEEVEELTEQLSNYKVDVAANNLRFGYSSFETIPSMFDFSNVTDYSYMFYRSNLKNFNATWDTSNAIYTDYMFYYCNYIESITNLNTSNVKSMNYMFQNSSIKHIPALDTSNVNSMIGFTYGCTGLISIPKLDFTNVTVTTSFFGIPSNKQDALTDIGGFTNLAVDLQFCKAPNVTVESLMNIINEAKDLSKEGKTATLTFRADNIAKLSEEQIAIASAKGWTLA